MKRGVLLFWVMALFCGFAIHKEVPFHKLLQQRFVLNVERYPQEKVYVQTDREHYHAGDRIWFRSYLLTASDHQPSGMSRFVYVQLVDGRDSVVRQVKIGPRDSAYYGYLDLPKSLTQGVYFLRAFSFWMQNQGNDYIFSKKIRVIHPPEAQEEEKGVEMKKRTKKPAGGDIDVRFFPEGGNLLAGNIQVVAFKALGTGGLGVDVEGEVRNDADELVAYLQSEHLGMGKIRFPVKSGRSYHAIVRTTDSVEKRINLPEVKSEGIGLGVVCRDTLLQYRVMKGTNTVLPKDLYLLVHSRGNLLSVLPVAEYPHGAIPRSLLPEGIIHLVLMDAGFTVYSDRLCFVKNADRPEPDIRMDKKKYTTRERVELTLTLPKRMAGRGSCSLSVVDDGKVYRDSLSDHILSYLLLTSDLKGYIENPAWYFAGSLPQREEALDLLMMTQGWNRFQVNKVAAGEYDHFPYYMERAQTLTGNVLSMWGRKSGNAQLVLLSTSGLVQVVNADSTGHFCIDGIVFPDSTHFLLQGRNRKGRANVEVTLEPEGFLKPQNHFPVTSEIVKREDAFFRKFKQDYYYDNGIKVYILDEAVVKRNRPKKTVRSVYDNISSYMLDSAQIAALTTTNVLRIFEEFPGVYVVGDKVSWHGDSALHMIVDGFPQDIDYVKRIRKEDLLSVSLIEGVRAFMVFGTEGSNGVLNMVTRPGFVPVDLGNPSLVTFSPLGYQAGAEFYAPAYATDSARMSTKTDERSTIYWNPDIQVSAVPARVSFYTADRYGTYTVIAEGVMADGVVFRKEAKIMLGLP